uniref:Rubredoxin-like domain-containing protein n=1 Tax=Zea mays TaxID=4577 RepID=A0A804M5Z5_MAIZE
MGMVSKQHPRTPPPSSCCLHIHHILYLRPVASSHHLARHSVYVTKDDKPLEPPLPAAVETESTHQQEDEDGGPKLDPRRFEEKFAVLNTGVHECRSYGHRYDQAAGDPSYPVPSGLPFAQLPDDWRCPTCGAAQTSSRARAWRLPGSRRTSSSGWAATPSPPARRACSSMAASSSTSSSSSPATSCNDDANNDSF